jgi:predicted TIM-barrel fold metal-dependent hydrolase
MNIRCGWHPLFSCVVASLAACTAVPPAGPTAAITIDRPTVPPDPRPTRARIEPRVDAHQHVMSPAAQALVVPHPELVAIQLPRDLAELLRARERVSGAPPVGGLFTDDAIIREWSEGRWWQGRARVDRFINNLEKRVRLVPKAYAADGRAGYIAGSIQVLDAGVDGPEVYNFVLGIRKELSGPWQIASEMMSAINPPVYDAPITADRLRDLLDDAGIRRASVLSVAYWFGAPYLEPPVQDAAAKTRQENDWTIAQTRRYPDRLVPFCSVNPLAPYALAELERCAGIADVRGMKIHLANSRVDLKNADHVARLRTFFATADRHGLALVVHAKTQGGYGAEQARIFLNQVMTAAPNVPVQLAHMANAWDAAAVYAAAIEAGDPHTRLLFFDLAQAVPVPKQEQTPAVMTEIAATLRRIGLERIFFGSDMDAGGNPSPRDHWKAIRQLPLTDDEIRTLAENIPPYLR